MNKFALATVLGLACIGTSVSAQDQDEQEANRQSTNAQQQQPQSNASEEEEESERVICRSEPVLGSRTRVNRVCMTKAQWDYQAERTREEVNRMGRNSNTFGEQ